MSEEELKENLKKEIIGLCETNSSVMTYMECLMRKHEELEQVADERMNTILEIEKYCIDEKEDLISGCEVCEDILKMIEKLKNKKYYIKKTYTKRQINIYEEKINKAIEYIKTILKFARLEKDFEKEKILLNFLEILGDKE